MRHTIIPTRAKLPLAILLGALLIAALVAALVVSPLKPADPTDETPQLTTAPAPLTLPPASIQGRVLRPDHSPVSGATVTANDLTTTTDADGQFTFPAAGAGTWRLDASAPDLISPGPQEERALLVELPSSTSPALNGLTLTLRPTARVTGRILAAGAPVTDAQISLFYLRADGIAGPIEPFALEAVTSSSPPQGAFDTGPIAPGRVRLLIEAPNFALTESRELLLDDGQTRSGLQIDLSPSGQLNLQVLAPTGEPLRAELVIEGPGLRPIRKTNDPQTGLLTVTRLPLGELRITASSPGFRTETLSVTTSAEEATQLDIVLEPAAGLAGRVLDSIGQPIANASIRFSPEQGQDIIVRSDPQGRFHRELPSDQRWTAQASSHAHAPSPTQTVVSGQEITLRLGPGGGLSGRVITSRGEPVQSYRIAVEDVILDGPRTYSPRIHGVIPVNRPDGAFELKSLAPGTYYLRAQPNQLDSALSQPIVVRAGQTTSNVTITVQEGGTVRGTVRDAANSSPMANVAVEIFDPTSPFPRRTTRTDAQGAYTLEGVSPGRQSLRFHTGGYLAYIAAGVEVRPAADTTRDVQLEASDTPGKLSFHGIGAVLRKSDTGIEIQETMGDSPAALSGIKNGDIITSVDGRDVQQMRLNDVVNIIRGEEGAPVSLRINRPGQGEIEVEVARGRVVTK